MEEEYYHRNCRFSASYNGRVLANDRRQIKYAGLITERPVSFLGASYRILFCAAMSRNNFLKIILPCILQIFGRLLWFTSMRFLHLNIISTSLAHSCLNLVAWQIRTERFAPSCDNKTKNKIYQTEKCQRLLIFADGCLIEIKKYSAQKLLIGIFNGIL